MEGAALGPAEYSIVGTIECTFDGSVLGIGLGRREGTVDGVAVGPAEGIVVG
jgi:hypothetical protein